MSVADVEIEGAAALPAEGLVELEELFHVPALGELAGQLLAGRLGAGAQKALELIVGGPFTGALHHFKDFAGAETVGLNGQRISRPMRREGL